MKQTAVEWLKEKMATSSPKEMVKNINVWFEEAIEMEKQQIIDAYVTPLSKEFWFKKDDIFNQQAEQYYNETYKPST